MGLPREISRFRRHDAFCAAPQFKQRDDLQTQLAQRHLPERLL